MEIIRIKEIADSTRPVDTSAHYSKEYSAVISASTARKLCGMYPLPELGHETVVAVTLLTHDTKTMKLKKPEPHQDNTLQVRVRLCVDNVGGTYVLQSSSIPAADWPEIFGVEVRRHQRKRA